MPPSNILIWFVAAAGALLVAYGCLVAVGAWRWSQHGARLVRTLTAATSALAVTRYDATEIADLPDPVRAWFARALTNGQPIIRSVDLRMRGTFNMSLSAPQWKPFTSVQHVSTGRPGFVWDARIMMFPGLPIRVSDSYIAGRGWLHPTLLGLIPVGDQNGAGEIARGELMRWFAEAVWYPTALLPSQGVTWTAVDATSASATMTDGPLTLTLLFRFGADGLVSSIHADARAASVDVATVMLPWECRMSDYKPQGGMLVPMTGEVLYLTGQGERSYFRGTLDTVAYEFAA